jgi:hypothetical protein
LNFLSALLHGTPGWQDVVPMVISCCIVSLAVLLGQTACIGVRSLLTKYHSKRSDTAEAHHRTLISPPRCIAAKKIHDFKKIQESILRAKGIQLGSERVH